LQKKEKKKNLMYNIPEFGVSQFNRAIKEVIYNNFEFVRIKGEISELKVASKGQIYLTLKDNESILSGVIWDQKKKYLNLSPEIGMEIIATGKITTWSKYKTTYQIDIDNFEIAGEGALLKLIEERKKRLKEKGLFDAINKKKIPYLPSKIGVITSPTGSVIHDIINRIKDRFAVPIDVWPVSVQGAGSVQSIINAIEGFNKMPKNDQPDVLIIARGGGSTEDLMTFNDEELAIKVFQSKIPIISAIGHETDNTIIDFIADLRASTPSSAAEKVVPWKLDLENNINHMNKRLNFLINSDLQNKLDNFNNLAKFLKAPEHILKVFTRRLDQNFINLDTIIKKDLSEKNFYFNNLKNSLKSPEELIKYNKSVLKNLNKNIDGFIQIIYKQNLTDFKNYIRLLYSNSIASNLKKGYSILSYNSKIIQSSKNLKKGQNIQAKLYDGNLNLEVKKTN